ncbi:probable E3 ubiquitin-protein ligase ARI2 isoform X1 [Daucus carota subsp. sativus]|uniref:probable E3 ubiquitin-protein ligase ARI2 isoform X1 n=2 Tax=Daucus carota subsp. sativus TaxID=79200 RepID=UPI0007DFDF53|nr:PREDICTED: probable E3 ubiquitin-protein ligase ARI2 [Daucus carota subsp. sativus]
MGEECTSIEDYCYSDYEQDSVDENYGDLEAESQMILPKRPSTKVITKESLLAAQKEDVRQVMELLSLREQHARTLLIHYRWDVVKLTAILVDRDRDYLFSQAGVPLDENHVVGSLVCSSTVMCTVCLEDVPGREVTKMDCGHSFCNDCWTGHFIVQINDGQSKRIKCMAEKCFAICDEAVIRQLVSKRHPALAEKFERYLLESYIEDNKMVKWCPSVPHCGNAIRTEDDEFCEVECSCGLQFCFSCLSEAHSPCSCLMWELWSKKCQLESETVTWISDNTKACPKCHKPVEKNGGCNLVRCVCGQYFCWLCGGATGRDHTWTTISGHSCGRYKEDSSKNSERAKRDLYRYMHYLNRFKAHKDSFKMESELRETITEKIEDLENKYSNLRDFDWVRNGVSRLFRSRRALTYSYPFAFYMFGDYLFKDEMTPKERERKQLLFEDQQQQLEGNVESLSKFLEEPFHEFLEEQLMDTRMQILNLCVITDNLCKKMYECIEYDLLGSLKYRTQCIAPYNSEGIEKAAELCCNAEASTGRLT